MPYNANIKDRAQRHFYAETQRAVVSIWLFLALKKRKFAEISIKINKNQKYFFKMY